jgi:sugar/nucleoside kinase (ribokinase family)
MTGPRVVCAGLLTVDLIHEVDRVPARNEKITGRAQRLEIGGPATNAARTAAALGADVLLVAPFGESPLTDFVRESLARNGVDWLDPAAKQPNPAPLSTVLVEPSGERSVISGGGMPIPPNWPRATCSMARPHS